MPTVPDASSYRISLCVQLLNALEADSLAADPLLKLARRLANALNRKDVELWLSWELAGYPDNAAPETEEWLVKTGRKLNRVTNLAMPVTVFHRDGIFVDARISNPFFSEERPQVVLKSVTAYSLQVVAVPKREGASLLK
jgi:hypothetical protein